MIIYFCIIIFRNSLIFTNFIISGSRDNTLNNFNTCFKQVLIEYNQYIISFKEFINCNYLFLYSVNYLCKLINLKLIIFNGNKSIKRELRTITTRVIFYFKHFALKYLQLPKS